MSDIYLVASVTYDFEEAKTVIAVRSDLAEAIRLASETPLATIGTGLAEHYNEVIAMPLDGLPVNEGGKVVWSNAPWFGRSDG